MNKNIIIIFVIVILAIIVWGFIGGQQAKDIGITCDMGIGDSLCWKWHTNIIGEIKEGISDTGDAIDDFLG